MMNDEPTLTRIRNARQRISASCGHDPYKLVEHYLQYQQQYQDRLIPKDQLINPAKPDRLTKTAIGVGDQFQFAIILIALQRISYKLSRLNQPTEKVCRTFA